MRFALVLAAVLALPVLAHAQPTEAPEKDELVIEGIGLSRDIPCEGQNIGIYGADNDITLTGDCGSVIVHGSGHEVSLEEARELVVSGADHTVFAQSVTTLSVDTTGHTITATMAAGAPATPAQVRVNGADQTLNLTLAAETHIAVEGTEQVINWSLAEGAPEPRIEAGGIDNAINRVP